MPKFAPVLPGLIQAPEQIDFYFYMLSLMKRSIEDTSIVMVGAGRLATNLAKAFYRKGFRIMQVYSRTEASARALAQQVEAEAVTSVAALCAHAGLYVVSLPDDVFPPLIPRLTQGRESGLWVHTAGSIGMEVWQGYASKYGVFYPMQTFSKEREVDFTHLPIFVEGCNEEWADFLRAVASALSRDVYPATSEQRRYLHIAAVFACNFSNYLYTLASDLLARHDLPFSALLPLIDETARKVHHLAPEDAQTGPAARGDATVMEEHLRLLAGAPDLRDLYRCMSEGIYRRQTLKKQNEDI